MDLKQQIFDANDRAVAPVAAPEWGVPVFVRSLTAHERQQLAQRVKQLRNGPSAAQVDGLIAANVLADAQGNRLFTDEDAPRLANKNAKVLDRIVQAYEGLNAITDEEKRALEKNS